jgi:hypothetical protein
MKAPVSADATAKTPTAVVQKLMDLGIDGAAPGLTSSRALAQEYLNDSRYADDHRRVSALINWETSKAFGAGMVTGLGGLITMPVAVPSGVAIGWVLQARLAAAIAAIYGHNVEEDRVRTLAMLALIGDSGKEAAKRVGIDLSQRAGRAAIERVPSRVLIDINKRVGFRLLTRSGTTGVINLANAIPILGGVVGGSFDAAALRTVGAAARRSFRPASSQINVPADDAPTS